MRDSTIEFFLYLLSFLNSFDYLIIAISKRDSNMSNFIEPSLLYNSKDTIYKVNVY